MADSNPFAGAFWFDQPDHAGEGLPQSLDWLLEDVKLDAALPSLEGTPLGAALHMPPPAAGAALQAPAEAGGAAAQQLSMPVGVVPVPALAPVPPPPAAAAAAPQQEQGSEQRAAPAKRRGGRAPLSEAEKALRAEKERELNRVMQARYRQRQKERRAQLEEAHEATTADLEREREQHSSLRHANVLLESLLSVRDASVAVLESAQSSEREGGGGGAGAGSSGAAWQPSASEPSGGTCSSPSKGSQEEEHPSCCSPAGGLTSRLLKASGLDWRPQQQAGGPDPDPAAPAVPAAAATAAGGPAAAAAAPGRQSEDADAAAAAAAARAEGLSPLGRGLAEAWADEMASQHMAAGALGAGQQAQHGGGRDGVFYPHGVNMPVTADVIEDVKRCTPEQYIRSWQSFVGLLRDMLAEYELTKQEQRLIDLMQIMEGRAVLMTLMLRHNPVCVQQLFASSAEHGLSPEQDRERWDGLVAALGITHQQRERYIRLMDAYTHKVERLRAHKAQAVTLIRQASMGASMAAAGGLQNMMNRYLEVVEAAQRLSAYPESEFTALLEVMSETGRLFTPLQKARILSSTYPHFPDILNVAEAVKRMPPSLRMPSSPGGNS